MQQPLISHDKPSQTTAKYIKAAIFVIFSLGIMVAFSRQSSNLMEENESSVGLRVKSMLGMQEEEKAPADAPLIDIVALEVGQMAAPVIMLTYTWREIPVKDPQAEQEQVQEAQMHIQEFDSKPEVMNKADSVPAHRAFMSSGIIGQRRAVILGFPGSGSPNILSSPYMQDWMRNIQSKDCNDWKKVNGLMWRVSTGHVNRYREHMEAEKFRKRMDEHLAAKKQQGYNYIYIFGHSLGGAQAQIAAADFVSDPEYQGWKVVMITMAAPRVFGQKTATAVNDYFKLGNQYGHEAWRFVNYGDQVPSLPLSTIGWEHVGRCFYINKPTGGKWTLQEQDQDFTPYHATVLQGLTTAKNGGIMDALTSSASTHFMTFYRDRLAEIRQTAEDEGLYSGNTMQQSGLMDRAKNLLPGWLGGNKDRAE